MDSFQKLSVDRVFSELSKVLIESTEEVPLWFLATFDRLRLNGDDLHPLEVDLELRALQVRIKAYCKPEGDIE
jgi:hypothetical protein